MEHVRRIPHPVRNPPPGRILTRQRPRAQAPPLDPAAPPNHVQAAHHPPRVTHVRELLGPAVEAPARQLALAQPVAQRVHLAGAQPPERARDAQRAHAREDLRGVRLGARHGAEAAVRVAAPQHVLDRAADVDGVQAAQQRQRRQRAVREARVGLAPLVAGEGAVGALAGRDVGRRGGGGGGVERVERVDGGEDLHGRQRGEEVRVVAGRGAEAARRVPAREHEGDGGGAGERRGVAQEVQGRQAPVDAREAEVRGQVVVQAVGVRVERLDVPDVGGGVERCGCGHGACVRVCGLVGELVGEVRAGAARCEHSRAHRQPRNQHRPQSHTRHQDAIPHASKPQIPTLCPTHPPTTPELHLTPIPTPTPPDAAPQARPPNLPANHPPARYSITRHRSPAFDHPSSTPRPPHTARATVTAAKGSPTHAHSRCDPLHSHVSQSGSGPPGALTRQRAASQG